MVQAVDEGIDGLEQRFDQRGVIAIAANRVGLGRRLRGGIDDVQLKIVGHFFDDISRHRIAMIDEGADQAVFAQQIRDPGDSSGVAVYGRNGFRSENVGILGAGNSQAFLNVPLRFFQSELTSLRAQGNALPELAQLRLVEFVLQFGLP